jgi:uncharacterized repeat protein (TIGR01451 family)
MKATSSVLGGAKPSRVGWLLVACLLATLVLWALIGMLNRPLGAHTLGEKIYVDGANGSDGAGCGNDIGVQACKTIQEAVANHAEDGDTVLVAAGSYDENVLVTRAITVQGGWNSDFDAWNPASYTTVISGQPDLDTVVISDTTAVLDGLTVFQGDDGVRLQDGAGARLLNLVIYGQEEQGIETSGAQLVVSHTTIFDTGEEGVLANSGAVEIFSATVHDTGQRGIYLRGSGPDVISDTVVYNTDGDGIRIRDAGSGSLIGNRVYSATGGGDGIQIDDVTQVSAEGNTVYDIEKDGLRFEGNGQATFRGNTIYDVSDDALDFCGTSVVIEDNRLHNAGDVGIKITDTTSISVAHNTLHDITEAGIKVNNSGTAWILHNAISSTVTGTAAIYVGNGVAATIDHNTVYSAAADGINFQGTTGQIRYNQIHQVGDQGINVNADDTTVLGNTVYDTNNEGLRVRGGSQVLIQDNTIYNVLGDQSDGIHVEPNATATIVSNTVHHADDDGIAFNGTAGTVSENHLHDNGASGIDVDAGEVTISANRVFSNGASGIELEQAGHFTVSNNLIGENAAGGVLVLGTSTGRLVNNTLVGGPSSPVGVGLHVLSDTVTLTSANNIVVSHTTGISVVAGAWVTTTFDDVWNNVSHYDGIAGGAGSIHQDPFLLDAVGRDYHLRFASPCIDAGWAFPAPPFDFEGDPRSGDVDIGADELKTLSLVKLAPEFVNPGELITYTIVITNHLDIAVTNVIVTDVVPTAAYKISAPSGTLEADYVWWLIDSIAPGDSTARVSFVVTATETITNDRYRVVTSTQGVSTGMGPAVVTTVDWRLYLPVVLKGGGS